MRNIFGPTVQETNEKLDMTMVYFQSIHTNMTILFKKVSSNIFQAFLGGVFNLYLTQSACVAHCTGEIKQNLHHYPEAQPDLGSRFVPHS